MSCNDNGLKKEHTLSDFIYYKLVTLVPFLTAIFSISRYSWVWTGIYLIWIIVHMGVVYRLLCTHCPHYGAKNGKTCCHFIWATPAKFSKHPDPLGLGSKVGLVLMIMASSLFPMYWLLKEIDLLILYLLSLAVLFATMMKYECTRCSNFHCPKNQVPKRANI